MKYKNHFSRSAFLRSKEFKPETKEKYGNTRVSHAGYSFDSKLEAAVFDLLSWREKSGEISNIKTQVSVYLSAARIQYIADFSFTVSASGETAYAEAKGYANEKWPLKRRLWIAYGPGILEIYKGIYKSPRLVEVIDPSAKEKCLYCSREKSEETNP